MSKSSDGCLGKGHFGPGEGATPFARGETRKTSDKRSSELGKKNRCVLMNHTEGEGWELGRDPEQKELWAQRHGMLKEYRSILGYVCLLMGTLPCQSKFPCSSWEPMLWLERALRCKPWI